MYCRKCGKKLDRNAARCPYCQTDVIEVRQIPYAQQYEEEKKKKQEQRIQVTEYPKEIDFRKNSNLPFALGFAIASFVLSIFPWPKEWNIGTALWMRILIVVLSVIAMLNSVRANQIHLYNKTQIDKYNKIHSKRPLYYERPRTLSIAVALSLLMVLVSTLSLFMG